MRYIHLGPVGRHLAVSKQWLLTLALVVVTTVGAGCADPFNVTAPGHPAQLDMAGLARNDLITSNASEFAAAVRAADAGLRVIVNLKGGSTPPVAAAALRALPLEADLRVATAHGDGTSRRDRMGVAMNTVKRGQKLALKNRLVSLGVPEEDVTLGTALPFLTVSIPEQILEPVIEALLRHGLVDFLEVAQVRNGLLLGSSTFALPPLPPLTWLPSSTVDLKHTIHNVDDAWTTFNNKGESVKIGVMDTGFTVGHVDGAAIQHWGFVDRYPALWPSPCDAEAGECHPGDDAGHGTHMAGIIGATLNSIGFTGIAPNAIVHSLKVAWVPQVANGGGLDVVFHDIALVDAVDFAIGAGFDILSMSFVVDASASFFNALNAAFNQADIFLVASVRSENAGGGHEPHVFSQVMGVAAVDVNNNLRIDSSEPSTHWQLSAFGGGGTLNTACTYQFLHMCTPALPEGYFLDCCFTSISTVVVAGIAGLLRSEHPSLTAGQVFGRMEHAGVGLRDRIDAMKALTTPLLNVEIVGPNSVPLGEFCSWNASVEHGQPPYSYQWSGVLSGSSGSVSGFLSGAGYLNLTVTDAASNQFNTQRYISIDPSSSCILF